MISLKKKPIPSILKHKCEEWTAELMVYVNDNENIPEKIQGRYRDTEIKDTLIEETNGKCAYCESKILHIDYGDIEHIEPKKKVPKKTFQWDNLTLSCRKCNLKKKEYYDPSLPLINPYLDNPEDEILFMGPYPIAKPGSDRAKITIKRLALDRVELMERRLEHIEKLQPLLDYYHKTSNVSLKEEIKKDILKYIEPDKEFSSMVRSILYHPQMPQLN